VKHLSLLRATGSPEILQLFPVRRRQRQWLSLREEWHKPFCHRMLLLDSFQQNDHLGDLSRATWSPDGKWIAAIEWNRKRLILLDGNDPSHRRDVGSTLEAAWSPDSRYLLVWTLHFLRCGIGIDVEPPASFEVLEVATGKRSLIRSSQCQLIQGPIGWVSSDIGK